MPLILTITDAGRAEIINAVNTGTGPVTIIEVGLGTGTSATSASQTALETETKRLPTIAGQVVADDTIHVTIKDETTDVYDVTEFGLFTDSGTLFAVYSQPANIIQKGSGSTLLLSVDVVLESLDAGSLTFGDVSFSNPPASETVAGVSKIATQAETDAGTDDVRIVTPKKLAARLGDAGFPSGTVMLFVQAAAPTGWTKSIAHNNKALRIVSGAGGGAGGSVDFTSAFKSQSVSGSVANTTAAGSVTVNNHTLSASQIPAKNISYGVSGSTSGTIAFYRISNVHGSYNATGGSGSSHNHSASFSGSAHGHTFNGTAINMAVKYVDSIIAVKD